MIILDNKKTYNFEGLHTPRIYINDVKQVREALALLGEKGSLTNKEMTEETARVRSEDIREIFYLLWRLDLGVDVTKKGREIAFIANEKLDSILELEDSELKKLVLEKLKSYNPFVAVLDKLIDYKTKDDFSEKDITKDFHNGRTDGGRIDNTHPLLRWSKDDDWGLVVDKKITNKGEQYVIDAKKEKVFYVHHTVDLKASEKLNVVAHIISDNSKKISIISFDDILGLISYSDNLIIDKKELISILKQLIKIGLPIVLSDENIEIKNKIYHDVTPKYYVKFRINLIDGVDELENKKDSTEKSIDSDKTLKEYSSISSLIVHDGRIDIKKYPQFSKQINYEEFLTISNLLPSLKIKNIILPPGWKPLKVTKISGILLAFVKSGGNLLIFQAPTGRIGSNRNLFNWLPHDLEKISFVKSNGEIGNYFKFLNEESFMFTKKDSYEEVEKDSKKYSILSIKYNQGLIILIGNEPSLDFFEKNINNLENNVSINVKSNIWIYRHVPSLNRIDEVNTEYDLYPILRDIMSKNFNIKFDPKITGKSGQTDLFIESPLFCCCEVTPPSSNATGFSKVAEVEGHRKTMAYKGKERFSGKEIEACVLGPSFTIEAGEDKSGAVDMANALHISLISYRDIYELICINENNKISEEDLIEIFSYKDGEAEVAIKIYNRFIKTGN